MTAPLTDYTTFDDIRAALGVSSDDLEDDTLGLTLYADWLHTELEDVALTLPGTYATVVAVGSPSDAQLRFLQASRMFATFAVAKQLSSALPLFAAKQVSDSTVTVQRFANPYKETIALVNTQYDRAKARLKTALAAVGTDSSAAASRVYVSAASPAIDRVTGV